MKYNLMARTLSQLVPHCHGTVSISKEAISHARQIHNFTTCCGCAWKHTNRTWNEWICEQFTRHRKSITERFGLEGLLLCNSWRRPSRPKRSVIDFICHMNYSRIHPFQVQRRGNEPLQYNTNRILEQGMCLAPMWQRVQISYNSLPQASGQNSHVRSYGSHYSYTILATTT